MSDPHLNGLARGRDEAVAAVYDRYGRALFRVAWTLLRRRQDAEDAVQDVFLGLARLRQGVARVENLRAYLFGALRHAAARLAARRPDGVGGPVPEPASADADRIDAELSDRLDRALATLPREQREVIALKVDGGLTFEEVGGVLGIPPATAASRYRYALEKLRGQLIEEPHASRTR